MANYLRPDVYVEEINSGEKPITTSATSVGAFVGMTVRGEVGKAVQVTSWTDFVNKFAKGMATPFLRSSYLANAVYGFYQNGGSICYISRIAVDSMAKAEIVDDGLTITAKDEGAWANDALEVEIKTNGADFDINVYLNSQLVETYEKVSNNIESENFFGEAVTTSGYIQIAPDQTLKAMTKKAMSGGAYNYSVATDKNYTDGLKAFDVISTINLIAIPGITTDAVVKSLVDYATEKKAFAIIDAPLNNETDTEALLGFRSKLSGNGAIYSP